MIEFINVDRSYNKKPAVNNLSFSVQPGKITGLLGPNGAGKTTTLRLLLGILPPDSGVIKIDGQPVKNQFQNMVGYVPEERGFYKKEKIQNVFRYLASLRETDLVAAETRFLNVLKQFELSQVVERTGNDLSKGQAQIVQLAIALSHNPSILVLDEPYSGLDPHNQEILLRVLRSLRDDGKYIVISTHLLEKADAHLDDIILLNKGSLVYTGALSAFMQEQEVRLHVEFAAPPEAYPKIPGLTYIVQGETSCEIQIAAEIDLTNLFQQFSAILPVTGVMRKQLTLKDKFLELTHSEWGG
jgi:ABC-2 type transport system ATP-binding protein